SSSGSRLSPYCSLMRPLLFCLSLALLIASEASAQSLTPSERTIARNVDAHNAEALALLERVVNINSGTMNLAGVHAVGDIFTRELQSLGFATRWEDEATIERAGHLVAEHKAA